MPGPNTAVSDVDGSLNFRKGVNSVKTTTVASPSNPDGLARNELAWLINGTVRDGGITPRNGWKYQGRIHDGSALFQGGNMYLPEGAFPYLMLSIGGHILKVLPDDASNPTDLSVQFSLFNPPTIEQAYFCQGEIFDIIQAGDLVTLPLFWDGATLRRSLGPGVTPSGLVFVEDVNFITSKLHVPLQGETTTITLAAPWPGVVGDGLKITSSGPSTPTRYAGYGEYEVTNIAGNTLTLRKIDYNAAAFDISAILRVYKKVTAGTAELPPATCMDYYMGRLWYAQGGQAIAGDMVDGPSGTNAYNFRDSILKVTENPLAIGGDGFSVPANSGNIRALKHSAQLNTQLGQGQLYMFTHKAVYGLTVPVSRNDWIDANSNNQPLQTVAQLVNGAVSDNSVVAVNGDLYYLALDPSIRSLIIAVRLFKQAGNIPISANVNRVLQFNNRELMHMASGIAFNNRLWMVALPKQTAQGIVNQVIVPLDFTPISTLEEDQPVAHPAWEGMYEGLDVLQLFVGDFGGRERAFAVCVNRDDGGIDLWELTDYQRGDVNASGEARTTMIIEFPAYTQNREFSLKELIGGEIWADRIYGEVIFKLEYRPDGDPCWHEWHTWKVCSAKTSCEDANNPVCYPLTPYSENYRQTMTLPKPPDDCQTAMARPLNVGYQFQPRLTVTGWCRIRGILLRLQPKERDSYGKDMVC